MNHRDPTSVDYADLSQVKSYASELSRTGEHMTVILRPGHTFYNIIPSAREARLLKDALVVYRTGEHK
jgi:hypothetical protein